LVTLTLLPVAALAQTVQQDLDRIALAGDYSRRSQNLTMTTLGMVDTNGAIETYEATLWLKGEDKFYIEAKINGQLRLTVIGVPDAYAAGLKIWRYDHVLNEYSWVRRSAAGSVTPDAQVLLGQALKTAIAWSRREDQRQIRLLAKDGRWLPNPSNQPPSGIWVRIYEFIATGANWQGTDIRVKFDTNVPERIERMEIYERFAVPTGGAKYSEFITTFDYTTPVTRSFALQLPANAKPAADLPKGG
jgi:hypothetical protein